MKYLEEFPDQRLINKLLGSYYDPKIKPLYVNIDYFNKEIHIGYTHNDFIDLFGNELDINNVLQSPGEYVYMKKFESNELRVTASTYIIMNEIINKKLAKIWR